MHYIYYLFHAATGHLLYIGRSLNPDQRRKHFERRTGVLVAPLDICQRYTDFDQACDAERQAIKKHKPPYNKRIASAKGYTGHKTSDATKALISAAGLGRRPTEATRLKLSKSNQGHAVTQATKNKIRVAALTDSANRSKRMMGNNFNTGSKRSAETKAKMSAWQKGKPGRIPTEETRAKLAAAHRGTTKTPETLTKMKQSALLRWQKQKANEDASFDS